MDKTGTVIKESKDIKELKMKMSKLEQQVKLPSSKNTVLEVICAGCEKLPSVIFDQLPHTPCIIHFSSSLDVASRFMLQPLRDLFKPKLLEN